MPEATVSAGLVSGMVSFAVASSADREKLLGRAGLAQSDLSDADNRIPLKNYQTLVHAAQDLCGEPAFALKWATSVDLSKHSIVGLIMNASPTMGDAFIQLQRYHRLALEFDDHSNEPRFALEQQAGKLWLVDQRQKPNGFPELTETAFARLVTGPRHFLDRPHVLSVHFTHASLGYTDAYEQTFQCSITFGSHWNALELHPDIASWPVALEPGYVFGILKQHADQQLEEIDQSKTISGKVEGRLMQILHTGAFTAATIAKDLGYSRQTLYRHLQDEGTSYGDIVNRLRKKLALEYLKAKKISVNETAFLLGYSDPAAFSRAFKRMTGRNPKDVAS